MKTRNTIWLVISMLALMFSACSAPAASAPLMGTEEQVETTAAPSETPRPTATPEPTDIPPSPTPEPPDDSLEPFETLVLNSDPPRNVLFNINTLAYELSGMKNVEVVNYSYGKSLGRELTVDIYYPPNMQEGDRLPVVIFGIGYRIDGPPLRNEHFYTSWGRMVAAAGMIGVVYDTRQPDKDLQMLLDVLTANAEGLQLDMDHIGLMSSSANTATIMSYLMQENRENVQFAVYYYGLSITPDQEYAAVLGSNCNSVHTCLYDGLALPVFVDPDLPLYVVKVGQDFVEQTNEAMDHFVDYVESEGAQVTVVTYEDGVHGFDTAQQTEESADIIRQTVKFMLDNFGLQMDLP